MQKAYSLTRNDLRKLVDVVTVPTHEPVPKLVWDPVFQTWVVVWVIPSHPLQVVGRSPDDTTTMPDKSVDLAQVRRIVEELTADPGRSAELFLVGAEFQRLASYYEAANDPELGAGFSAAADQLFTTGFDRLANHP